MKKLAIAICLTVAGLGAARAETVSQAPDDDDPIVCPASYHEIEGLGMCAQNDGTEDSDTECPQGWDEFLGLGDAVCVCPSGSDITSGGWCQPSSPPSTPDCPAGWHHEYEPEEGGFQFCVPGVQGEHHCKSWEIWDGFHCQWPPPKTVYFSWDEITVTAVVNAEWHTTHHYTIVNGRCPAGQLWKASQNKCAPACSVVAAIPCYGQALHYFDLR